MTSRTIKTILTTLLVAAFGWGSAYLVITGIRALGPDVALIEATPQQALTLQAYVSNPAVPEKTLAVVEKPKQIIPDSVDIIIGGDVMFDRGIRALGEKNGYDSLFSENLKAELQKADIAAVNLEGPITSNLSKTLVDGKVTDSFTFTFSSQTRNTLKNAGIDIVSQANNHADNFGLKGYLETQDWLSDAGILRFGNPWNGTTESLARTVQFNDSPIVTTMSKNGIKVAFVGYHAFQKGIDNVVAEIKRVASPDTFVIVIPHWGTEYSAAPTDLMRTQARAFIKAGADAVIGAHSHVIGQQEWVDGVPVIYSLGNLLFDQYFSPEVMKGQLAELHIVKNDTGVHLEHLDVHETHIVKGQGAGLVAESSTVQ